MKDYLKATNIIDYHDKYIQEQAKFLALNCDNDEQIAKACFLFVRDEIKHSGDYPSDIPTTYKASEVLEYKTGWCYAKAILRCLASCQWYSHGICLSEAELFGVQTQYLLSAWT